jgi:hypothetical protein
MRSPEACRAQMETKQAIALPKQASNFFRHCETTAVKSFGFLKVSLETLDFR